jgi:protein-tyrosine sulfotransferase
MSELSGHSWSVPGRPYRVPHSSDVVFVLCMGRSGSTLLRFLLDTHPLLACPPETNLPALCEQLAVVWSLIEGAPLSPNRGDAPPVVPDGAVAGIRHSLDMVIGSYLARRGKQRFCEKSLGTARFTELLLRVYPDSKFLCLYRHPMDVIRSALGACPWGLSGYGFDSYAAASPGNTVLAVAKYWLDQASMIAAVEDQHADRCHRVRYEDLAAAPETVAREVFGFLGVPCVPGIAERCFTGRAEPFGPGDHKIWTTSKITTDSVGSGQGIPPGLIPPPVAGEINKLLGKLGYVPIDDQWGTPGRPSDPRQPGSAVHLPVSATPSSGPAGQAPAAGNATSGPRPLLLADRLRAGLTRIGDELSLRWPLCATETFLAVARPPQAADHTDEERWLADLATGTLIRADADTEQADWSIVGPPDAWQAVLSGNVNLSAAFRRWDLRYCDASGDGFAAQVRISMLAKLLGPAVPPTPPSAHPARRPPSAAVARS